MAYYKVNGLALTSIFHQYTLTSSSITTNYNELGVDIQTQFDKILSTDSTDLNNYFKHDSNTNYKVNGLDMKNLFLPYFSDYVVPTAGSINIPSWCTYMKCILIGAGGGGGGGDDYTLAEVDYDAGSSGGGGAFCVFTIQKLSGQNSMGYIVGSGGGGGGRGYRVYWQGHDGFDGESTLLFYNSTYYTAHGGGKGYGGNGTSGTDAGVGAIAGSSSSLNKNGNNGTLGTIGGIASPGGLSGFDANYTYQDVNNLFGRGGRGGSGMRFYSESVDGNPSDGQNGRNGYIRVYFCI